MISKTIDKAKLNHWFRKIKFFKDWQLAILLIISIFLAGWALRQNNLRMVELRQQVIEADESGEMLQEKLTDLGDYVIAHMNTKLDVPVELPNTYNRDFNQALKESGRVSTSVSLEAEEKCTDASTPSTLQAECIQREILESVGDTGGSLDVYLPTELYSHNFASPVWSPDLAGFMVLLTIGLSLLLISSVVAEKVVKFTLRSQR